MQGGQANQAAHMLVFIHWQWQGESGKAVYLDLMKLIRVKVEWRSTGSGQTMLKHKEHTTGSQCQGVGGLS